MQDALKATTYGKRPARGYLEKITSGHENCPYRMAAGLVRIVDPDVEGYSQLVEVIPDYFERAD